MCPPEHRLESRLAMCTDVVIHLVGFLTGLPSNSIPYWHMSAIDTSAEFLRMKARTDGNSQLEANAGCSWR